MHFCTGAIMKKFINQLLLDGFIITIKYEQTMNMM